MTEYPNYSSQKHKKLVTIEPLTEEDIDALIDLKHASWVDTYPNPELGITVAMIENYLNKTSREAKIKKQKLLLEDKINKRHILRVDRELAGVIGFKLKDQNIGQISEIYLHPDFIGKGGYGSKLMNFAIAELQKLGATSIFVEVAEYNLRAINFYKKFNFEFTTKIPKATDRGDFIIPKIRMDLRFKSIQAI